ncbi:MAG: dihydrofolate reductase [Burkholderiales bacterium]|nr:dihydrofolate reductase [Burkholderiales bacterium]
MASPPSGGAARQAALAIIAAVARNGVIGAGNALPWRLPADLAHFRALTTGHTLVMGRRTWQSLRGPLPNRQNIVVSRDRAFAAAGATVVPSLADALRVANRPLPHFCIGGAQLYAAALPQADLLYLTEIDRDFDGDTSFPAWDRSAFVEIARTTAVSDDGLPYAFVTYARAA